MDSVGAVYTPGAGGDFTVLARAGLACRLALVNGASIGDARAELTTGRQLLWDVDYALPESCQVEVDGQRYNPVIGTEAAIYKGVGLGRAFHHRHVDVVDAGI